MKELEASAGTVYPTLQQLEDEGLVTVQAENGKKIYSLTDEPSWRRKGIR